MFSVLGISCAHRQSEPPQPVVEIAATCPVLGAERYSIGGWHLGLAMGEFASSKPDLWGARRMESGRGDRFALGIGSRYERTNDPMNGSHLVFVGLVEGQLDAEGDGARTLIPKTVFVLGDAAIHLFQPALPTPEASCSLGKIDLVVDHPLAEDDDTARLEEALASPSLDARQKQRVQEEIQERAAWPRAFRVEAHPSNVATISVDGRPLGYVLGEIARDPNDRFYKKQLRRLVLTHLRLR